MLGGDALVLGDDDLAGLVAEIETSHFTAQTLGNQMKLDRLLAKFEGIEVKEARAGSAPESGRSP
jgi:predicted thioesterase